MRIEYPGAIYHVMSRGDRRDDIFYDDVDRQDFIKTLAEACQKTGWQVHAYCLMANHFHLVVETPLANLVAGMRWLLGTYTIRLNSRHKEFGHVFSGRYKASLVDGVNRGYLKSVCDYVHLNPVRSGLLKKEERLLSYPWSSFGGFLAACGHRPSWLRVDRLLGEHGIEKDTPKGRLEFERRMEMRRVQEDDGTEWSEIRRGWCYGSEEFRREMLERTEGKEGENHGKELHRDSAEVKAEKLIAKEVKRLGWSEQELRKRHGRDPSKLELAWQIRHETTLTMTWIATRLHLGKLPTAYTRVRALDKTKLKQNNTK